MIYLDNAATTRPSERVVQVVAEFMRNRYGNPSSLHVLGTDNAFEIGEARHTVGLFINAPDPEHQIIFTSGGTEANNMAIWVAKSLATEEKQGVVITDVEHDSVYKTANSLAKDGNIDPLYIADVDQDGIVNLEKLEEILKTGKVVLASIMYVSNEIGTVNDIKAIADLCHKYDALLHVDCVQAAGALDIDVEELDCDFASVSSHKIHGPKGVGAFYAKNPELIAPLIIGGAGQESGKRGGTENVAGIMGFSEACGDYIVHSRKDFEHIEAVSKLFINELKRELSKSDNEGIMTINGNGKNVPKILSITFKGIDAETLVLRFADTIAFSSGSACHAHSTEPSRALIAIGMNSEDAMCTVRFSFSRENNEEEVAKAARMIGSYINEVMEG